MGYKDQPLSIPIAYLLRIYSVSIDSHKSPSGSHPANFDRRCPRTQRHSKSLAKVETVHAPSLLFFLDSAIWRRAWRPGLTGGIAASARPAAAARRPASSAG